MRGLRWVRGDGCGDGCGGGFGDGRGMFYERLERCGDNTRTLQRW